MVFTPNKLTHTAAQIDQAVRAVLATQVQLDDVTLMIADFKDRTSYTVLKGGCNSTTRDMRG